MTRALKFVFVGAAVFTLLAAGGLAMRGKSPSDRDNARLLDGLTLAQITDRVKSCGEIGKATHEKVKSGQASDAEKAAFEECGRFIRAAKGYFAGGGAIILDAQNGAVRAPQ